MDDALVSPASRSEAGGGKNQFCERDRGSQCMDDAGAKEWERLLSELDAPQRVVLQALLSGEETASCALLEQNGTLGYNTRTRDDALATVKFRLSGASEVRVRRLPLAWVARVAAEGALIEEVSAPEPDCLTWTAAAWAIAESTLPAGLVLPAHLRGPWQWLVYAQDDRGLAAAPHSGIRMPDGRLLGKALTDTLAKTTIPGSKARMNATRRNLGENLSAIVASTAATLLNDDEAVTGADGGSATIEWWVLRRAMTGGAWHLVARGPSQRGAPVSRRRGRLFEAILKAAEADAFGAGINSPRGSREIVSLDQPVGDPGEGATLGDRLAGAPDVVSGLEIADLVAAAGLTERERDIVVLLAQELTQQEIAARLGIAPGTVANLSSKAKKKLRRARSKM
jgi:Sigma-70, region 4